MYVYVDRIWDTVDTSRYQYLMWGTAALDGAQTALRVGSKRWLLDESVKQQEPDVSVSQLKMRSLLGSKKGRFQIVA